MQSFMICRDYNLDYRYVQGSLFDLCQWCMTHGISVNVCVCVCVREKEREREKVCACVSIYVCVSCNCNGMFWYSGISLISIDPSTQQPLTQCSAISHTTAPAPHWAVLYSAHKRMHGAFWFEPWGGPGSIDSVVLFYVGLPQALDFTCLHVQDLLYYVLDQKQSRAMYLSYLHWDLCKYWIRGC